MRRSLVLLDNNINLNRNLSSGIGTIRFKSISFENKVGEKLSQITSGEELVIILDYVAHAFIDKIGFSIDLEMAVVLNYHILH